MYVGKKPIVRWTIGGKSHIFGFRCLRQSIISWKKIYNDEFDLFVCYNNIDSVDFLDDLQVNLIKQEDYLDSLPILPGNGPEWKLYPPRISINNMEVFIDNDLIVYKKIELSNDIIASTAVCCSYGSFDKLVENRVPINTGFFVCPSGYDFKKEIISAIDFFSVKAWSKFCDEQGLVAHIFQNKVKLLSSDIISTCHHVDLNPIYGLCGSHFVGLNRGNTKHYSKFSTFHLI